MRLVIAAVVAALFMCSTPASAAPQQLQIERSGGYILNPVEQQSPDFFFNHNNPWFCTHYADGTEHPDTCVRNRTGCVWDVDDNPMWMGWGNLDAGQSAAITVCAIADGFDNYGGDDKFFDLQVYAPRASLTVTVTDSLGNVWNPSPVKDGQQWLWSVCHRERLTGPWVDIPDSNGGVGIQIDYDVTISAATKTRDVVAYVQEYGIGYGRVGPRVCPYL